MNVTCEHCGKEVPIEQAHKTEWKRYDLEWYYCDFCENNVFKGACNLKPTLGKSYFEEHLEEVNKDEGKKET